MEPAPKVDLPVIDFKANWRTHISGRGWCYEGLSPIDAYKSKPEDMKLFYKRPWRIRHPETEGKLYRITGLHSFCVDHIWVGQEIGLLIEEWK